MGRGWEGESGGIGTMGWGWEGRSGTGWGQWDGIGMGLGGRKRWGLRRWNGVGKEAVVGVGTRGVNRKEGGGWWRIVRKEVGAGGVGRVRRMWAPVGWQ